VAKCIDTVTGKSWVDIAVPLSEFLPKRGGTPLLGGMECAEVYVSAYGNGAQKAFLDDLEISAPRP
jgi:hypothetical protein